MAVWTSYPSEWSLTACDEGINMKLQIANETKDRHLCHWHSTMSGCWWTNRNHFLWSVIKWYYFLQVCRQEASLYRQSLQEVKSTSLYRVVSYSHVKFTKNQTPENQPHQKRPQNTVWNHKCMNQFWKKTEKRKRSSNRLIIILLT